MNLYVYYDVAAADAASLADQVRAMQATLGLDTSSMQLMRRADTASPMQTWMEIYHDVPADFEARLAASVDAHGLAGRIGTRHVERFITVDFTVAL